MAPHVIDIARVYCIGYKAGLGNFIHGVGVGQRAAAQWVVSPVRRMHQVLKTVCVVDLSTDRVRNTLLTVLHVERPGLLRQEKSEHDFQVPTLSEP